MQLLTVPQLQAIVRNNNLECADRRVRKQLEAAVSTWEATKAVAIEVKETIVTTESEAIAPALTAAITIEVAAVAVFQALTSPKACAVYRAVLQAVCLAVVFMALLVGKVAAWCWEHRSDTAVYCWCEQWLDSPSGKASIAQLLIVEWVLNASVETIGVRFGEVCDRALVRLGLGGAIETQ